MDDKEAQRRSFVYGNTALSNSEITKELVNKVADNMQKLSWWRKILNYFKVYLC